MHLRSKEELCAVASIWRKDKGNKIYGIINIRLFADTAWACSHYKYLPHETRVKTPCCDWNPLWKLSLALQEYFLQNIDAKNIFELLLLCLLHNNNCNIIKPSMFGDQYVNTKIIVLPSVGISLAL